MGIKYNIYHLMGYSMPHTNGLFKRHKSDRFIPPRLTTTKEVSLQQALLEDAFSSKTDITYQDALCHGLWGLPYKKARTTKIIPTSVAQSPSLTALAFAPPVFKYRYNLNRITMLDAPNISDDYYHNVLCWGDLVYVGLGFETYSYDLPNNTTQRIDAACIDSSTISALHYTNHILLRAGLDGSLQVLDTATGAETRKYQQSDIHKYIASDSPSEIFCLSPDTNRLSQYDYRVSARVNSFTFPNTTLVGLSSCTPNLALATTKTIKLLDTRRLPSSILQFNGHSSPSKAVAFSPGGGNKIASGGGIADKSIVIWSSISGKILAQETTGHQVCGIHWTNDSTGLFVSEGFGPKNGVACWTFQNERLCQTAKVTTEGSRVLFSAQNPKNPAQFVTGCCDERIMFWSVDKKGKRTKEVEAPSLLSATIR